MLPVTSLLMLRMVHNIAATYQHASRAECWCRTVLCARVASAAPVDSQRTSNAGVVVFAFHPASAWHATN